MTAPAGSWHTVDATPLVYTWTKYDMATRTPLPAQQPAGGRGGRGNTSFKNSRNQAPRMAENGLPGRYDLAGYHRTRFYSTLDFMGDEEIVLELANADMHGMSRLHMRR